MATKSLGGVVYWYPEDSAVDSLHGTPTTFDPDDMTTLIDEDAPLMEEYGQFQSMVEECGGVEFSGGGKAGISKWVIRFELDREAMLDKNISMDDIHFADTPSLELIEIVMRRVDFARLAILMTGRSRTGRCAPRSCSRRRRRTRSRRSRPARRASAPPC